MDGVEAADDEGQEDTVEEEAGDLGRHADRAPAGAVVGTTRSSTRANERASVHASSREALEQYGAAVLAARGRASTPRE